MGAQRLPADWKNRGTRSSPQYHDGKLYFGTGSCAVVCLDAASGKEIWKKRLLDDERLERMEAQIFYSPVFYEGKLFIGYSGRRRDALLPGCRDGRHPVGVPDRSGRSRRRCGTGGGSLWTSGAIDEKTNVVYNVTGSNKAFMPNLNLYTESISRTISRRASCSGTTRPTPQDAFDLDFCAHPMVFDAAAPTRIRGGVRPCVAAGTRAESSAGTATRASCTGRSCWVRCVGAAVRAINAIATAYNRVYAQCASPVSTPPMAVTAGLNAYSGDIEWIVPNPGMNSAPLAVANGVIYQGLVDGKFEALDANNGRRLWEYQMPSAFRGGAAIANGAVYASNGEPSSWAGESLAVPALDVLLHRGRRVRWHER